MTNVVAAQFRAEQILVARNPFERDAEQAFAHTSAVIGRGVYEIHAQIERDPHGTNGLV